MDKISYDIKIFGDDFAAARALNTAQKKVSLKKIVIAVAALGICSIIFGFIIYFLVISISLIILILIGLKFYNQWTQKRSTHINEKEAQRIYAHENIKVTFDHEKIIFGKSEKYYKDVQRVLENNAIYYFGTNVNPSFPENEAAVIIPKRYIDKIEFENFILKTALAEHFSNKN
ncbi:hypothetical protein [Flavobacterium sp. N2038]|uniref:hypothetical protein n=1 Tax=Flavobacterium sp. N2038 TaxID=2986829 RepID=UPI002224C858|nr:hypothetical protein [Flavobacterium sp. N2038]